NAGSFFQHYCIISSITLYLSGKKYDKCARHKRRAVCKIHDISTREEQYVKYITFLLFTALLLYGIISNMLMGIVLFCGGKDNSYNHAFILIASQLIISNLLALLPQLTVVLPEMLQTTNTTYKNQTTWINHKSLSLFSYSYVSVLQFSFLLTLNRFVTFVLPKYNAFFKSTRLHFLIAFARLSVFAIAVVDSHFCKRRFLIWYLAWEAICVEPNGRRNIWWRIRFVWVIFLPNIMFIMYAAIFYSIRRKNRFAGNTNKNQRIEKTSAETKAARTYRYEWSMLIQAAWNYGGLEVGFILFNALLPFLVRISGKGINVLLVNIFANSYAIFSLSILPSVHFIYSKRAHNIMKHHLNNLHSRIAYLKNKITIIGVRIHAGQQ
uniref:G-protein coupled receptors family 1 profile domain-containing protein n=1 Tax=Onchocerca volvulus TaxID=6282 RepID=A0A8R1U2L9_ONCVO